MDADGLVIESCLDNGDPADWVINPPCPSLESTFESESIYGSMSMEGLEALACIINGYDGDHLDWKIVDGDNAPLILNQPDGPLFQNFISGIGDHQGRWARYRDAIMYKKQGDTYVSKGAIGPMPGDRAEILFNPQNGRLDFPTLRPLRGMRPPWPPNNHSGAPTIGETGTIDGISPLASRAEAVDVTLNATKKQLGKYSDGVCPPNPPVRSYDMWVIV